MHRHLHLVARPQPKPLRPAKVISLEARRQARLEEMRPEPQPKRPAA
jgi:hypothetical protein